MTITKANDEEKITLAINGWLDVETVPQFKAYIDELEKTKKLVLDFKDVEYISSLGIREIVALYKSQKSESGEFGIINIRPEIMEIFSITGLDKKIDMTAL